MKTLRTLKSQSWLYSTSEFADRGVSFLTKSRPRPFVFWYFIVFIYWRCIWRMKKLPFYTLNTDAVWYSCAAKKHCKRRWRDGSKRTANAGVMAQTHCKECKKNGKNYHFIDAVYMPCESRAPHKRTTNAGVTAQTHCKRWCDGSNAPHRQVWRLKRTINAGVTAQTHHKRWRDGSNAPQTLMWRLKRTANGGVTAQKKCIFSSRFLFRPCHLTKTRKLKKALSISVWEKKNKTDGLSNIGSCCFPWPATYSYLVYSKMHAHSLIILTQSESLSVTCTSTGRV